MPEHIKPITVNFPLIGEWCAVNTPGYQVPSHGTNQLGQRYAYDFLQIDWGKEKGYKFFSKSTFSGLLFGVRLADTYCWSQPLYAPFDGEVVEAKDGCVERNPVHIARDLFIVLKNAFFFDGKSNANLQSVLGNYVILKNNDEVYCLMAHARNGSIAVSPGQKITAGQKLAEVGHSGNSTAPHLHFQLMDRQDLLTAIGLPCCFSHYLTYKQDEWQPVENGIPGKRERIRFIHE